MDIDGFYYDQKRGRYFRIMPGHVAGYDQYTTAQMTFQNQERHRLEMMDAQPSGLRSISPFLKHQVSNTTTNYYTECTPSTTTLPNRNTKRKTVRNGIPSMVCDQQLGCSSTTRLARLVDERRLVAAPKRPTTSCKVLEDTPDVTLDACQYLDVTGDGKMLLGGWGCILYFSEIHIFSEIRLEPCLELFPVWRGVLFRFDVLISMIIPIQYVYAILT